MVGGNGKSQLHGGEAANCGGGGGASVSGVSRVGAGVSTAVGGNSVLSAAATTKCQNLVQVRVFSIAVFGCVRGARGGGSCDGKRPFILATFSTYGSSTKISVLGQLNLSLEAQAR